MAEVSARARAQVDQELARIKRAVGPSPIYRLMFGGKLERMALGGILDDVLRAKSQSACANAWLEFLEGPE